ncbi:MAG: porin family protein [Syntrophaceae bacterium]|nr:porin family protein [Syntrophaceae bacterium]
MKRLIFAVVFLVFSILSTTTFAASPAYNWTGFYIGAHGFYGAGDDDEWDDYEGGDSGTSWRYVGTSYRSDHDIDGWMGGAFVGYNYQFPFQLVVGIETDINFGEISGSKRFYYDPAFKTSTDMSWVGSTRLRLGYAIYRFLPYIAMGMAYGEADIFETYGGVKYGEKNTYFGWSPALGVEFVIVKNLIGRAEFAYYSFANERSEVYAGQEVDTKIRFGAFKLGLCWKF